MFIEQILSHVKVKLSLFTKFDILNVLEGSFLFQLGTGNLEKTQPCWRKVLQSIPGDYFRVSTGGVALLPCTLKMSGEWTPVRSLRLRAWARYLAHHTLAALSQNAWAWEKGRPGRRGSTPCRDSQDSERSKVKI